MAYEVVFLALGGLVLYMLLVSLMKLRVEGVLVDERQVLVSEKAAQVSFRILLPILGLASLGLVMAGNETYFTYVRALGVILSYVTCLGLAVYVLSYWFFDRQSGGR